MSGGPQPTDGSRELLVFRVRRDTRCGDCDVVLERGSLLRVEGERALCLAGADLRARRRERAASQRDTEDTTYVAAFAAAIGAMFPGCPTDEATQIAAH